MKIKKQTSYYNALAAKGIKYLSLFIVGALIIFLCSFIQKVPALPKGEYYYSTFFMKKFTLLANILFIIAGFAAGYIYQLNPWLVGISLNLIFPLTSIIEGIMYKGSHNLIPLELAFQFWFALPSIIAAFVGRFIFRQIAKRKAKANAGLIN